MRIYRTVELPKNYASDNDYSSCELDDYDLLKFRDLGVEEIRYWYATGSYCGVGEVLMFKDGKWYHADMGHCSCYGPTEHIESTIFTASRGYDSMPKFLDNCSTEEKQNVEALTKPVVVKDEPVQLSDEIMREFTAVCKEMLNEALIKYKILNWSVCGMDPNDPATMIKVIAAIKAGDNPFDNDAPEDKPKSKKEKKK